MSDGFVRPAGNRHITELVDGVEQIRIPVKRNWFIIPFLLCWLVMWTFGGAAIALSIAQGGGLSSLIFLCFWAIAWVFVLTVLFTQIWGAEIIRASAMEVELVKRAGPMRRRWRYRADQIHNLTACPPNIDQWGRRSSQTPVWARNASGAVKFDYGAQTIMLAAGVDEAEGRMIAQWLTTRLPMSATASAA
ncbi:MAG: hypothetical protein JWM65_640 [Sphingomonas bacterium]|nr:hypothetical protein [Sphingomonas bacterium]